MKKDNTTYQGRTFTRRQFFKTAGAATIATSTLLAACSDNDTVDDADVPVGKMTYRVNRSTGDRVSLLGYGMMRLPTVGGKSGREDGDGKIDQELVNKEVDYAIAHGVNYFDTSPVYCQGRSETATGIALSRYPRDKYFIATKLSNFNPDTWPAEKGQEMFRNSLKNLKVDYVDYMLLHAVGNGDDGVETFNQRYIDNGMLDWLVEQKEAGKIRNLGFSFHGDIAVFDSLLEWHDAGDYHWDFVQIELNYLDWKHAHEIDKDNTNAEYLYAELEKRGIQAIIMEPLLGGRLSDVPDTIVEQMKRREPKRSVASWAFRYAGSPDGVLTVLSGMTYMENLKDNIISYSPLVPVTDEEKRFLSDIAEQLMKLKTIPCNDCKYCMPCPYGIDIPAIFVHYNKCIQEGYLIEAPVDKEGEVVRNPADKAYQEARRAFLIGYDRSVPKLRQANHCVGCHQCESHCPQRIKIADELRRIDNFVNNLRLSREM